MSDVETEWAAVRAWLADPATHGLGEPVRVVETHANTVFLAGRTAYKLKKPVRFPFLDYATRERRRAAAAREIEVNRANAPALYRGLTPVTREADGRLALGGAGEPVEWLVEMARFDETATLDRVIEAGPPADDLVLRLAETVADAQARAPRRDAGPWIADLAAYVEQNDRAFRSIPEIDPPAAAALHDAARLWHARLGDLLAERGRLGFVRLLHGDLHSGNVALIGDRPVLFDAIEFDDRIATADLLYDAGFLVMDLDEHGRRAAANLFLNRFLVETARREARLSGADAAEALRRQVEGLAALPFFLMLRAAIRSKVTAAKAAYVDEAGRAAVIEEAKRYFQAAAAALEPAEPVLVAIGGLSGSGKSTLARCLAPLLGRAPGALHLRSDVVRKLLARRADADRLPAEAYTPEASARVYAALRDAARAGLAADRAVIVDAVNARAEERDAWARLAAAAEARFVGLWLDAPAETLATRAQARSGDASDADRAVVEKQLGYELGPVDWPRIDAAGGADDALAAAVAALGLAGIPLAGVQNP